MSAAPTSRVILFAGYSANGKIMRTDLDLLRELSQFGEVHAHYDNDSLDDESLAEAERLTGSLTLARHGEYDFGSWKRLIARLGDDYLARFDELVMVNDSIVTLASLAPLFDALTSSNALFFSPILIDEDYPGPSMLVRDYLEYHPYDMRSCMFASFFWSLRRELFTHYTFKRLINSVGTNSSRVLVSHSYERGFSRTIFRHKFSYATLVDKVYPYSAVYTTTAYLLAASGFPVIKKKAIHPEYYPMSNLQARTELLTSLVSAEFAAGLRLYLDAPAVQAKRSRT